MLVAFAPVALNLSPSYMKLLWPFLSTQFARALILVSTELITITADNFYLYHQGLNFVYINLFIYLFIVNGDRGSTVVKVLCCKSEGCWFDPSWCNRNFSLTQNTSDITIALGSNQRLREMSTRCISWG